MTTVNAPAADDQASTLRRLIDVGIALSAERNHDRLMERILLEAKEIYNADGGTLYVKDGDKLVFSVMRTDTMNIKLGGTTGTKIPFPPLALYGADGKPNHNSVATHVALTGELVNIPDAYKVENFDFSGTKRFDAANNYRSKSFLTLPLKNYENEVVGVLQLINARERGTGQVTPFDIARQSFVEALASQAAVALDNHQLLEGQRNLLESFVKLIANAIDRKSPYTSGHCQRVPVLTNLLAEAACAATAGPFADFRMTEDERYELHMAAWMHDCGKVVTPEYSWTSPPNCRRSTTASKPCGHASPCWSAMPNSPTGKRRRTTRAPRPSAGALWMPILRRSAKTAPSSRRPTSAVSSCPTKKSSAFTKSARAAGATGMARTSRS
jgi:hypothetical protein